MTTSTDRYTADLARRLRVRGVAETEIGDAVRAVEEHVRDSGRPADEVFGPAREYARTFPPGEGAPEGAGWYVLGWLVAAAAGALLLLGLAARGDGDDVLGLVEPTTAVVIGAVVLTCWAGVLLLRLTRGPRR